MKKMEHESNKSGPNPGFSPKSEDSNSLVHLDSLEESSPPPQVLAQLYLILPRLRNTDVANLGVNILEDLGILDIDMVIGSPDKLGEQIRNEICYANGVLRGSWRTVGERLLKVSPGTCNPNAMLTTLCQLAAAKLFTEGRLNARV